MTWAWILWGLLAAVFLLDALRMRRRMSALPVLDPSDEPVSPEHRFLVAPGVALGDDVRRAASAHARKHGLEVIDLVPGDTRVGTAWSFVQLVDPEAYRKDVLGPGRTAGHAVLVTGDVLARARVDDAVTDDLSGFVRSAMRLKRYAVRTTVLALAPGLAASPVDPYRRREVLRAVVGEMDKVVVLGTPIVFGLAIAGLFVEPVAGALAFVALHLQQALALGGIRGTRMQGLAPSLLLRVPLELAAWVQLLVQRPDRGISRIDAKRAEYEELMAGDRGRFFEKALLSCPLCRGALEKRLENIDLLQYKPGRFKLDRCLECGHIFQNPRLSLEGLSFYYRDFYDGLGEDALENIFSWASEPYVARARMVEEALGDRPGKVLDVGCGHGHFSLVARDVWPGAELDGLDLSDSVEDAARRKWIDQAYRGLFPELAGQLSGRYDVVGMSHYLEHTIDPESEIAAAAVALRDGGMFLIELPDPESPFGRFLGRLWLPWFQPQHLHLLSVGNLEKLLRRHGFEPVTWHRGEAHQKVDLMFATYLLTRRIAPPIDVPWRPRPSLLRRLYHTLIWTPGALFILAARIMDRLIAPLVRRLGASNTYRVVARKASPAAARAAA